MKVLEHNNNLVEVSFTEDDSYELLNETGIEYSRLANLSIPEVVELCAFAQYKLCEKYIFIFGQATYIAKGKTREIRLICYAINKDREDCEEQYEEIKSIGIDGIAEKVNEEFFEDFKKGIFIHENDRFVYEKYANVEYGAVNNKKEVLNGKVTCIRVNSVEKLFIFMELINSLRLWNTDIRVFEWGEYFYIVAELRSSFRTKILNYMNEYECTEENISIHVLEEHGKLMVNEDKARELFNAIRERKEVTNEKRQKGEVLRDYNRIQKEFE